MTQILCPNCRTQTVPAPSWTFDQTSVEVPVCSECREATAAVSVRIKVSRLADLEVPATLTFHRSGLVGFWA